MEFGETEKKEVQLQVPWIPITPSKPILQRPVPILPRPVPIYTSEERRHMGSHFTCFESSTGGAEINRNLHRLSDPAAATRVHISFDNISSSSNSFSQLLSKADAPVGYSYPTHGFLSNQFVPALNSQTQFNQTYAFIGHQQHLSCEQQPFFNVIHDNYQDPQGAGISYPACYGRTTSQDGLPPENVITAKDKPVVVTQINMEEREQGREEENVSFTMCNYPHNNLHDSVVEFTSVSTPSKESFNHKKVICHDIDLNKMPQSSRPKRKKHRPKVIKEGKPKKITKPAPPKTVPSQENLTDKRKHVTRKGSNSTPQTELTGEWTKELMPESAKKTCRRSLNFDTGEQPRDGQSACRENETAHFDGEIGIEVRETRVRNKYMSLQEDAHATTVVPSKSDSLRAKLNAKYAEKGGNMWGSMNDQGGHEDNANIQSKSVYQSSPNDSGCCTGKLLIIGPEVVGSKRTRVGTIQPASNRSINLIGAQYNLLQAYSSKYCVQFPNVQKKRRSEKRKFSNTSFTSSMTTTKDVQLANFPQEDARSHSYSSTSNGWISRSAYERAIYDKFQLLEYNLSSGQRTPTKRRSRVTTRIHDYASLTSIRNYDTKLSNTANLGSSDRPTNGEAVRPQTCIDALAEEMRGSLTKKKRSKKRSTSINSVSSSTNVMQQHNKFVLENHSLPLHNSLDVASEEIRKNTHSVDTLTEQLRHLNIYREARELVLHGQNALVPYIQQNEKYKGLVHEYGTIIPFEGPFDPIKKQRPRPKVDLDEETSRVWKLLMLDINSHGIDGTDEDKAKWWEEERNVFRGRADSFIARMHLVQGDRRFSRWKGSVVDSVVGVFLTQNVSDHLSSSAFMSLAARFPLKSSNKCETYHEESTSLIVDEPQVQIVEPKENAKLDEKILNQSVHELSSVTREIIDLSDEREAADSNSIDSCGTTGSLISLTDESSCKLLESAQRHLGEHSTMECANPMIGKGQENSCHGGVRKELNALFSSKCSIITSQMYGDFPIDQNPGEIGSFSDGYSEVEDFTTAAKYKIFCNGTSSGELLGMASLAMLHEVNSQRSNPIENSRDSYGQSVALKHDNQGEKLEKSNVTQDSLEATVMHCNEHISNMTANYEVLEVNCFSPLKVEVSSNVSSKNKNENDNRSTSPTESESQSAIAQPHSMPSQLHLQQQSDHEQHKVPHISGQSQDLMQKSRESDLVDHNYAMRNENSKLDSAPVKLRGKVRGKEKKDNFDWDSLRIQAQTKVGKREKTESTMDSLDWDAVRRADVNEIANAIRERGMNNMLAERIKSFLNLLVDKHGGIDLEWLRDVPPDQAKEYLLSIRGLGLKSVECVRLLTLHHLAFPVDTNVGRIAVRLGWVPLQPLPESLQLHLLELYPVLESIQKYLWPRLCKLDQRTLYELHYQLITFGKVFCTKSKPNCNACPMRGECRHFASAFASARLALPGPEQKSIVTTTGNNATEQNPSAIINQLPLPLPENTNQAEELQQTEECQLQTKSEINICQPIIEEPATPEAECSQVSENDIEDAFYEDSSEIPTIKLDMEEFTMNLQNYMQENMELQEGEMSKALVALHPEAACIPTPKLKNVSRLRTEHSVYELPDSHHLLEGWDIREPDDPGRYLLAIWTPGETANSIDPPETKCISQDCGQLCNEKECFSCNSFREADSQTVRGTLLIPCRTAMRGSFPLNGTYFQVNEVFADHDSSINPVSVPRSWIWNLNRRTVYFGTSVPSIFKGLSTQEIQQCFWRGFVCVRGFDRKTRAPRPLMARLHYPASKLPKNKEKTKRDSTSANSQGLNSKPNTKQPELLYNSIHNFRQKGGS